MRLDLGVAGALAIAIALTIRGADEPGGQDPDAFAYLLGTMAAAWVLLRRRYPLGALVGTIVTLMAYFSIGYSAFSPAVALTPTVFFAALAGRAIPAGGIIGFAVVSSTAWQVLGDGTRCRPSSAATRSRTARCSPPCWPSARRSAAAAPGARRCARGNGCRPSSARRTSACGSRASCTT